MSTFSPSPAELGKVKNNWIDSYNGQKTFFVDTNVLIYSCGSTIKVYYIDTKTTVTYVPNHLKEENEINSICLLTANASNNLFAFSDTDIAPKVHIYQYGSTAIKEKSKLIDGATIEYLSIEFSNGDAILTLSGIPDLNVTIWNWKSGERIGNITLDSLLMYPTQVSFSPFNWRNLIIAYDNEINIWRLDMCDTKKMKLLHNRFTLPATKNNEEEQFVCPEFKDEFPVPNSAIAALDDSFGILIDEVLDKRTRYTFKSAIWCNTDELIIASKENFIFKYSISDASIKCIFEPPVEQDEANLMALNSTNQIKEMFLHRQGVFTTFNDGTIKLLDGKNLLTMNRKKEFLDDNIEVKRVFDLSTKFISNLSFNKDYSLLAISSNKGVFLVNSDKLLSSDDDGEKLFTLESVKNNQKFKQIINFDFGATVSISSLGPFNENLLLLKENGSLQLWNTKKGLMNRFSLNQESSYMTAHPKIPLVVVGSKSGVLTFLDYSSPSSPRVIENCALHKGSVRILKFNSTGTLLFSLGEDNRLFLIDTRLNESVEKIILNLNQVLLTNFPKVNSFQPGFYVLGYLDIEGEAVCLDSFDYLGDSQTTERSTRVVVGIHDASSWDVFKKTIQELPIFLSGNDAKSTSNSALNATNSTHNLLVNNLQMQSVIPRLNYVLATYDRDYNLASEHVKLASKVLVFDFSFSLFNEPTRVYASKMLDFKDESINKYVLNCQYLFSDFALTSRSHITTFTERFLVKLSIPEPDSNKKAKVTALELVEIVGTHDFGYGVLSKTNNSQILVSGGYDGLLTIRKANDVKTYIEARSTHFNKGGLHLACFTNDNLNIGVVGNDGTISLFNWICNTESTIRLIKQPVEDKNQPIDIKLLNPNVRPTKLSNALTWFELKEKEFFKEQDAQYLPIRHEISKSIVEIRKNLQELMKINDTRESLAKLPEHEFYLDVEELERLHKESDNEIVKIREKTEFDNLAKLYVREQIKKECWDNMKVKGRGIQAFNTTLLVENYPLREQTKEEIDYLERIKFLRRIELSTQKTRLELTSEIMKKENIGELAELDEDESKENDVQANQSSQVIQPSYLAPNLAQLSYKGSIGSLFNGDSPYFYHQFELYTREQKWTQITLVKDAIYRIKENFNKEFEQVMQRKYQEIGKIKEKNQRLKQIYIDLNEEKQIAEPQLTDAENPEQLFEVKDEEIKVEKYLTPEQRKALEDQLAEEARRREAEKLDNWRDRGLMDMMGGVLQIRREDELKKEIPVPSFSIERPPEEWTPEEVKLYQIYEQKVKELNEERDKLRKQLNTEINKINEQIIECYQNFDNQLLALHQRKVKTQQAIYQEELKITRLFYLLLSDDELQTYDKQNNLKLEKFKDQKKDLALEVQQVKKIIDSFKEEYEILLAEDKIQDKAFLREFSDVSSTTRDVLLKLFKKRPKQRIQINKTNLNPNPMYIAELGGENPYSDRPSTHQQQSAYENDNEAGFAELDSFENAPGGVDTSVWERFVQFRRQKVELENTIRIKSLVLNEMTSYLQRRIEEDENKKKEIEETIKNSLSIQDQRLKASHNLQVQLLMKQGQVEINPGAGVHNYENCLLIHRNVVESLNKIINTHGKQKISIMVNCKDFRKGIRQLEWEHRKMKMTIEDYIQKQRDITYLKLSREIQEYLSTVDYEGKKQKEISILEQTIAFKNQQYEKLYGNQSKKLKNVRNYSVKIANLNDQYDDQLKEKNVILHDHKHISEEITGKGKEAINNEKMQQIIQRRKLVDLAKAQAQEVAFLRSEVERLRMKTFPALVQIEY